MDYSHGYRDHITCEPGMECVKCKAMHSKPKCILLECGEGTGSRTFTTSNDAAFQLAHVTVDASSIRKPKILIKFSSIVSMERLDSTATVRLQYELFRICDGGEPTSLGIWIFEQVNVFISGFSRQDESFSFIFCECANISKCCEYFVTVTPIEISSAAATVSNGRMAALYKSLCDFESEEYKTSDDGYDDIKPILKHPKAKEILLSCGQGNGDIIFRDSGFLFEFIPPADIAHVTIDTNCLSKPKVLIEFSSVIIIDTFITDVILEFELFRVCSGEEPLSRGIWTFIRTDASEAVALEKVFDFTFCECDTPSSCCEYFVKVTPIEIDASGFLQSVVVSNVRITALAQSTGDCHYYDNCKILNRKNSCIDCVQINPKPKDIILECGEGNGRRSFVSSNDPAFQLAHVNIDTTCLCKPVVNIEFSSIVSFEKTALGSSGRIRYELFRVCDNRKPISLGIWVLERLELEAIDKTTNIFNFTFCDCITCSGCCDYIVTATPIFIEDMIITVSDGRIAALAQASCG